MLVSLNSSSAYPANTLAASQTTTIGVVNPTATSMAGDPSLPDAAAAAVDAPGFGPEETPQSAAASASEQLARLGASIGGGRVEIDPFKIGSPY
ncbi:hypothetical protein SAMN06265338_102170 [Rhodoblastus acidophilus]|uniref:Uncharacterized protein n=2 Tax=Rhodoblastus acidophilus TaxID=1074 RepID=A0A212QZS2_RHOAC|nr:hypothetical protein [Rhodoblastus acidophilus]MCW2315665.1 hypothetical protein [Rhodoblastus acidophilus]PPQ40517.1 hypothetical protein CKO16_01880 [Rhodoblastus acidophilus]RAI18647.1 hypothetical protein CH337_13785 [Rhodoblastus acidophilus]SNB65214.1 hypothetical protein SAMN06265338_102170 [Rhodoblastus acidophilus]